uniref:maestro heat-like repeat-containing protein family member 1 n=1 Tax=Pristiophorus japonicus TaxID=55135 RepID=UPI00398E3EAB
MVTNRIKCSMALIISLFSDEDDFVPMRLTESLQELGRINHKYVLTYCHKYLTKNKLRPAPRWALLTAMTLVIKDNLGHLHTRLAKKLSNLALMNMIRSEHVDHQEAASCLLVSLGARFPIEIFKHIESGCQPWTQAYFFVVLTLARLCRANVHCLVPRIKPVLRNMLPTLHGVTDGEIKWTLCVSLGLFSESIQMYLSNPEGTRKPKLEKKMFFHEISAAYDLLLNSWLPMKEPKVTRAILETVAQIIQLVPNDKLDKELPSLIPTLVLVYQETFPHVSVTRCLCSVLRTAIERNSEVLVTQLQILLITFHEQICIVMEQPQNTLSEKQLNEILCCFRVLAPAFTSQILEILRMQLAIDNEQIQLGALSVLKYLLDTVPSNMESQKDQILNCVRRSLLTGSNRVKGILAQVIYTMACHNYLEREGGKQLMKFIIQQCALPTEENEESTESEEEFCSVTAAVVTDKDLRRQCEGLLKLMVGTLPIGDVLWSYLLEFVITVKYTEAFTIVCGSSYCVGIKRLMASNTQFVLNYEDYPNLPEPRTLLTRLLIVSSSLCHGKGRGVPALGLLYLLAMDIHPATVRVWDKEFPMLCNFLEVNSEKPNLQNEWEEKLLGVVSQTLEANADKVWITQLIAEMTHCIHTYRLYPTERAFLYKCLGRVLRLTQDKDIVSKSLHQMLQSVEHNEDFERDRVAAGIGDCAVTHLDTTLTTLKAFMEFNRLCISSPFPQVDNHIMKVKSTLILCYGQIMSRCPRDLILPRIETDILHNVLALFNTKMFGLKSKVKDLTLKLSLTNTVILLAKALQPSEEHPPYTLSRKAELLSCMQELITAEPKEILSTWVRKSAMDACAALIKLQPSLSSETELISICLNRVFSLPDWESSTADQSTNMDMAERQKLHTDTMASVQGLLKQCLLLDLSPDGLHSVFKTMETEIQSTWDHEREKAMESTLQLVTFYLEKLQVSNKVPSHNLLVSTLLINLSFSVWVRFPTNFLTIPKAGNTFGPALRLNYADACHYSAEILRAVLSQGKGDDRIMREMGGWDLIVSPRKHHEGVTLLASTLTACAAPHLISIVEQLTPCLDNIGESQRITKNAFFGELLNHSVVWDLLLMDTLLESLFRCLLDESPIVQWLAVQGLGNAAIGASQRIDTYCTKLLSTMLSVIDQKSKPENLIAVEAMSSMCKVLGQLQEDYTNPILGDVAMAVQPYLEHQHETMRAAAFNVLGKLIRFGSVEMNPPHMEHIKSTLIRLLLHLNAESIEVTNVCKSVLNSYAPVMESANISKMFQELSSEETTLDYENYLSNISRHIAKDLDNQIPLYIRSCAAFLRNVLPAVRGNALTFLAFLMYNAPPHYYTSQSAAQICEQIIALLSDHEQDVRTKAAKTMRYLYM